MEIIELILFAIGVIALVIIAICNIYSNSIVKKQYKLVIENQYKLYEDNKEAINNLNTLKEHFNKNISDIAKTFNFYDKRIIALEERHYKRRKKIDKEVNSDNADKTNNVQ